MYSLTAKRTTKVSVSWPGFRQCRDDDKGLRIGPLIGERQIDVRLVARRRDLLQALQGSAGQAQGRLARRQIDYPHVAKKHPGAEPGPKRLGASLLGGEALGIGIDPVRPALGAGA